MGGAFTAVKSSTSEHPSSAEWHNSQALSLKAEEEGPAALSWQRSYIGSPLRPQAHLLILENSMGSLGNISQTILFHSNTWSSYTRLFFSHLLGFSPDVCRHSWQWMKLSSDCTNLQPLLGLKLSQVKCNPCPSKVSVLIRKLYSTYSEKTGKKALGSLSPLDAEASLPRIKAE